MRIFYAVPGTPHEGCLPQSRLWYCNLYLPLTDLGHEIVSFEYDFAPHNYNLDPAVPEQREFIRRHRPLFSEELLKQIKAAHRARPIQLFFSYFYSSYVEPDAIRQIRNMGIVTVNWYCNASYQFHLVEEIAPAYDFCLVPERFRLDDYRKIGANPLYCQEAANPAVYKSFDLPQEFDVTFVGQRYGTRPLYVGALAEAGVDVRVWGPHWDVPVRPAPLWRRTAGRVKRLLLNQTLPRVPVVPPERCGPPLSDEAYIRMYSRSRISLGFSAVADVPAAGPPIKQVRLRDFEAPMCGAFYLVERFEELADFFEPDKEIVWFLNQEELVEKVRYYLRHHDERERIREAGLRRARREHTWQKRLERAFGQMGLG